MDAQFLFAILYSTAIEFSSHPLGTNISKKREREEGSREYPSSERFIAAQQEIDE